MKRVLILAVAVLLIFSGCAKKVIPPELTMASNIRHSRGYDFYPEDYCRIKSHSGGNISVTYTGEVDISTEGEYNITVTADDEYGGEASKDVTVTVQEDRSGIKNKEVCENLLVYIKEFIAGAPNLEFRDHAEGFGKMASAYSIDGRYEKDGVSGRLMFEAYQLESERLSVFNAVFTVDEKAMWYIPQKVVFSAGDTEIEMAVNEGITENGKYGCYAVINEYGENSGTKHPDYAYIEKIRNIAEYDGDVIMRAVGTSGSYEFELTAAQKKDFADVLAVYEEMITYYK